MPLNDDFIARIDRDCVSLPGVPLRGLPVVIDTNTVLDVIFWNDKAAAPLTAALRDGRVTAVRDREVMIELAEVLSRAHFLGTEEAALKATAAWCASTAPADEEKVKETGAALTVRCRDPLDQKFLDLAVATEAKLLVTKDKLVLKAGRRLKRFGVTTLKPEEAADAIDELTAGLTAGLTGEGAGPND